MQANLTTISGTVNPIAKNYSTGNIENLIRQVKAYPEALEAAVKFNIGTAPVKELPGTSEPELNKSYLLNFYIDNLLHSSFIVRYLGMNENYKWYVFQYVQGNAIDGQERHLLNAAEATFPTYTTNPSLAQI